MFFLEVSTIQKGNPVRDYHGYVNDDDSTKSKVLRDVFKTGDAYFR